jgi:NAD(P)H dehydrogenase (quinone)
MPEAEYATTLKDAELPEDLAEMLTDSGTGASKGGLFDDGKAPSRLIGRPTTPLGEVVKQTLAP